MLISTEKKHADPSLGKERHLVYKYVNWSLVPPSDHVEYYQMIKKVC